MNRTIFFSFENSASTRALADSPFRTQSVHAIFDRKRALLRINKSICHALKSDKSDWTIAHNLTIGASLDRCHKEQTNNILLEEKLKYDCFSVLSINLGFDPRLRVAQAIKNSARNSGYFSEDSREKEREREKERCIKDESLAKRWCLEYYETFKLRELSGASEKFDFAYPK